MPDALSSAPMRDPTVVISTVSAAVAARAALATLGVAWRSLREGRTTIEGLKALAAEAANETAAQKAILESMNGLTLASRMTATVLHAVFLEAQAAREFEALVRVRVALAEVVTAIERVLGGQPEFVFFMARQNLLAALAGVADAAKDLPATSELAGSYTARLAGSYQLPAEHEVDAGFTSARERLASATHQATNAMALDRSIMPTH